LGQEHTEEAKEDLADEGVWVQSLDRIGTILTRWFFVHQSKKAETDEPAKEALHEQYEREFRFIQRNLHDSSASCDCVVRRPSFRESDALAWRNDFGSSFIVLVFRKNDSRIRQSFDNPRFG